MAELFGPVTALSVHRLRAVFAHVRQDVVLHLDERAAVDGDPGARLHDGKVKLCDARVAMEYLAERHGWQGAFSDRIDVRARERDAIAAFDRNVLPAFEASLRGEAMDGATRKAVLTELRELGQVAHATGYRTDSALALWTAPAALRMHWLRDVSPFAAMLGEWLELGSWLDAAAAQPAVARTGPDRATVHLSLATARSA